MRLLTWNVQWCRGLDGIVDPVRIAREARRVADPDVLCFQEINAGFADLPGSQGENQVEALKREFPGYFVFFAAAVDVPGSQGARKRFGNLIATRFPVGRVLRHTLPWPRAKMPSMPRAALETIIQAPFGPLRVLTTHNEAQRTSYRLAGVPNAGVLTLWPFAYYTVESTVRHVDLTSGLLETMTEVGPGAVPGAVVNG